MMELVYKEDWLEAETRMEAWWHGEVLDGLWSRSLHRFPARAMSLKSSCRLGSATSSR